MCSSKISLKTTLTGCADVRGTVSSMESIIHESTVSSYAHKLSAGHARHGGSCYLGLSGIVLSHATRSGSSAGAVEARRQQVSPVCRRRRRYVQRRTATAGARSHVAAPRRPRRPRRRVGRRRRTEPLHKSTPLAHCITAVQSYTPELTTKSTTNPQTVKQLSQRTDLELICHVCGLVMYIILFRCVFMFLIFV